MKTLLLLPLLLLLIGCGTLENYEFGDISNKLVEMKKNYCSEQNEGARLLLLLAIRKLDHKWVPACSVLETIHNSDN